MHVRQLPACLKARVHDVALALSSAQVNSCRHFVEVFSLLLHFEVK